MNPWMCCALVFVLGACSGGQNEPRAVPAEAPPRAPSASAPEGLAADSPGPYRRSYSDPFVQHAYRSAVSGCFYFPREALAKQLRTTNDAEAIARAYSLQLEADAHREAGYLGCMEGLNTPGAGQRKQFGK